jgi:NAD(P)H-dependent flavin oxidoreductase YrpB (nitropropane dioxygenase family)
MEAGARDRFRALLGEVMSDIVRSHSVTPLPARTLARRRKA